MASTYTSRLGLELQADGENSNTWGSRLNSSVISLLDTAIAGLTSVALSSAPVTLTKQDGSTDQARSAILYLHGVLTSNCQVVVPSATKPYVIWNAATGNFNPVIKTAGATGQPIPRNALCQVFCDSVSVWIDRTSVGNSLILATDASAARAAIGVSIGALTSASADSTWFVVSASKLQLKNSGVSAASYVSPVIQVNTAGQVTSISNSGLIQRVYATPVSAYNLGTVAAVALNSAMTVSSGLAMCSVNIAPKLNNSKLHVRAIGHLTADGQTILGCFANSINVGRSQQNSGSGFFHPLVVDAVVSVSATTTIAFTTRAAGTGTQVAINGTLSQQLGGGQILSTLIVEEWV